MSNSETLKVLSVDNVPDSSQTGVVRTAALSEVGSNKPTYQLPIRKDQALDPGMIVEVTSHTTEPNEKGGTCTTFSISPKP